MYTIMGSTCYSSYSVFQIPLTLKSIDNKMKEKNIISIPTLKLKMWQCMQERIQEYRIIPGTCIEQKSVKC